MKFKSIATLSIAAALSATTLSGVAYAASEAHKHIGHVVSGWKDTPEKKGLLPTALGEAEVAAKHAGFAIGDLSDLKSMKLHAGHVRHAIDAASEAKGPGLGYGLVKAAEGAAEHAGFAAAAGDASDGVKTHANHVITSTNNAVARAKAAMAEADAIVAASSAEAAAPHAKKLAFLTRQILSGVDLNGDGKVSWKKDEGGLYVADKHMGFMLKGEGLER